jgi:hypothetical protein
VDELELVVGDMIFTSSIYDDGWAKGTSDRGEGIFPFNYVTPVPEMNLPTPPTQTHVGNTRASNYSTSNEKGINMSGEHEFGSEFSTNHIIKNETIDVCLFYYNFLFYSILSNFSKI